MDSASIGVNKAITVFPSVEDLLHMSTLVPLPSVCAKVETWMPAELCSEPTTPSTISEELEVESLDSPDSQTSTALYSLHPRLPITYNEAALSRLQGRPQVLICNNHTHPQQQWVQYRWHQWQHFIWWHQWFRWLPCRRSHGRFIMPTERITNSRDRHAHLHYKLSPGPLSRSTACLYAWGRCPHSGIVKSP